jgi:hypothetical protein
MKLTTVIIVSVAVGLLIVFFLSQPKRTTQKRKSIIDPSAHAPNPFCAQTPVSCDTDADCNICVDAQAMTCSEQANVESPNTVNKYCLPSKPPDRPCNIENGGRWLYTGWGRIDPSIENDWECQCTYATVAGKVGCTLNDDVCAGGVWDDVSWETSAPDPSKCICPSNTVRITRQGVKPMCLPKSTVCYDEASCNNAWNK